MYVCHNGNYPWCTHTMRVQRRYICNQLACLLEADVVSFFGKGSGPVFLDNVQCIGTENDLLSCLHSEIGNHRCEESDSHVYDVGIICTGILNTSIKQ